VLFLLFERLTEIPLCRLQHIDSLREIRQAMGNDAGGKAFCPVGQQIKGDSGQYAAR